ncbi:DNA repair protein RadC [Reichenbachiella carrageenanivorans]|uniref:DNA repair protein RadC n=1 Tax=Reichenbachiella carrageenanivorans TaxID=2979869 RepID=A0ABY6D3I5_9BACT|nr:DNA repair protein RadC [Reichenbachiella carrageenanivorans]UXX79668.1 DNA repair protein RadC [Reichenbachiella carrageenanivorans]
MYSSDNLSIKQWAEEDRPREKLIIKGKAALSEAELIAILIGSGTPRISAVDLAKMILAASGNDLNQLAKLSLADLKKFNGIGEAKAIAIISALELGRRRKEMEPDKKPKIQAASDAYLFLKPHLMDLDHEQFWVIYLNRANQLLRAEMISAGGVSGTVVDAKLIFKKALEVLASQIVLAHNHPSGNLRPSEQDIRLTKKMKAAGQTLDIPVLDHIIFTDQGYFSFSEQSMMS